MGIETALVGGGLALAGSFLGGQANKSAAQTSADAQRQAASTSADAQVRAAQIAAEQAKFRPVGVTTGFGTSNFTMNPETGQLEAAGYTLTPEMQALRNKMIAQASAYDPTQVSQAAQPLYGGASSLFNLGQQYLATSPEAAAQQYMQQQRGLLSASREQQLATIRNQLAQSGRAGLSVGGTEAGNIQASNPELQAYYNALAQQEAQLAANADLYGQQRTQFGAGLFGTGANLLSQVPALTNAGYSPLQTQLGLASSIESLGQDSLNLGAQLGGRAAQAGGTAAQALLQGGMGAAQTLQAGQTAAARTTQLANQYSPTGAALTGLGQQIATPGNALGSWFNSMISTPKTGQTTNWFGATVNDPTYGAGTAYNNMTSGEIANMQQYGI